MNDNKSLAHSKWNCKYHIVSALKYRRKEVYGKLEWILEEYYGNYAIKKEYIDPFTGSKDFKA